ncbi:haloalkane dehalogenase [Flavobacteriaceae bacterium]|uniref:haloalkane dehalogenase n=1 Tax=Candidatus Arcticimaribacter forsetii TaxID=2820661 RepID=UPI0020774DC0|nr:haloalkane dehalogenase [Candidatus Arcticimaribacter forsetii]MDA8698971.1 haloalkane dehalogenase [Flavobacteriaceae bacterium]MDB2326324.1 haloalkane dehalogenase [Flavobacteriaceae bacterium]MDB2329383.1 haloalkane dehalogenase [Flavobacteriaceae bacterium]MDB2345593.1 haloalkane dehalogenase [Flavobacteriaceae bacterium]MDB4716781.1 haloalkane dehalogenase [Flavobacteriaceae bacterium]
MNVLRTPETAFENLKDYSFKANYHQINSELRMHYLDEGNPDGPIILLLHGEPSWSYLYRTMIPTLVHSGFRVIAPDLIGFGKSDKPSEQTDYSYASHIKWTHALLDHLELKNINIFIQDWGGLIGLRLLTANPNNFTSVVAGNTMLPTGSVSPPQAFLDWQNFAANSPEFDVATVIQMATTTDLSKEVLAAYNAPFPDDSFKAGARVFPALVPTTEQNPECENNKNAWKILTQWKKPFLTLFSDQDPITKGGDKVFQKLVPGTKDQEHKTIKGGHFLQEDAGPEIAELMVKFYKKNKI